MKHTFVINVHREYTTFLHTSRRRFRGEINRFIILCVVIFLGPERFNRKHIDQYASSMFYVILNQLNDVGQLYYLCDNYYSSPNRI